MKFGIVCIVALALVGQGHAWSLGERVMNAIDATGTARGVRANEEGYVFTVLNGLEDIADDSTQKSLHMTTDGYASVNVENGVTVSIAASQTLDTVSTVASVTDVANVQSVDLVDLVTTVSTVTSVTDVANVQSVDLVDLVTTVSTVTSVTDVANVQSVDTVDLVTAVGSITNDVDVIITDGTNTAAVSAGGALSVEFASGVTEHEMLAENTAALGDGTLYPASGFADCAYGTTVTILGEYVDQANPATLTIHASIDGTNFVNTGITITAVDSGAVPHTVYGTFESSARYFRFSSSEAFTTTDVAATEGGIRLACH